VSECSEKCDVDLSEEGLALLEERARELAAVVAEATPGSWLQPLEDEQRAIVSSRDPDASLLGLDRDGMAIFYREEDATFVVVARSSAPTLSTHALALVAEVRRLRDRDRGWRSLTGYDSPDQAGASR
jgi:hypothetical protein